MNKITMQSVDTVLDQLKSFVRPISETETIPLLKALSRTLAEDINSNQNVPPHDNSAMDGYALCSADNYSPRTISQRIPAGVMPEPLQPATAARIFTGAPIPEGADVVVEQEATSLNNEGQVVINRTLVPGRHIRRAGEDISQGQRLLPAGKILSAVDLGLVASIGISRLPVRRKLRVGTFFTGDELTEPGTPLSAGKIYNSNRYWLVPKLQAMGCEVHDFGIVPDNLDTTCQVLEKAAACTDVIITSGGVSVGEEDHVKNALQKLGELTMWRVAMKPGKPLAYGRLGETDFIGLPGNPVSGFVVFEVLIKHFLQARSGRRVEWYTLPIPMKSGFEWSSPDMVREEFLRVRRARVEDEWRLLLYAKQGSGVLTSCSWADGLVRLPAGKLVKPGDMLNFLPFED